MSSLNSVVACHTTRKMFAGRPEDLSVRRIGCNIFALIASIVLFCVSSVVAFAQDSESFLPVDEAFSLTVERTPASIIANWKVAPGYYLYESRMSLQALDDQAVIEDISFPLSAIEKEDPYFGLQWIYHDAASMVASYHLATGADKAVEVRVRIKYQGCAEAGLCYPPQHREFALAHADISQSPVTADSATTGHTAEINKQDGPVAKVDLPTTNSAQQSPAGANKTRPAATGSESSQLAEFLSSSSMIVIVATFFILGLGLTFTPCVLPMVPILSSIIAGQKGNMTTARGFALSFSYVMGMAFTYTILGVLVGFFGAKANVSALMQQGWVLAIFSGTFVLLALSMFGFYEIQLPSRLRDSLDNISRKQQGGEWLGVTLMGMISALVVSPCVSAPLAGALLYISSTGDAVLGGMALFALSLGMGAPLIAIGSTGAKLLPKAGAWMDKVKHIFGIILIGVALWLLQRVLNGTIALVLWSLLLVASGLHVGALTAAKNGWQRLGQAIGLMLLLWGALVLVSVALGKGNLSEPLSSLSVTYGSQIGATDTKQTKLFTRITQDAELSHMLGVDKPLILDVYADWCISCKVMDEEIFAQQNVRALSGDFNFVQLDVTEFTAEHKAMLDRYGLVGPPAILFFNPQGDLIKPASIAGEVDLNGFLAAVDMAKTNQNAPAATEKSQ